MINIITKYQRYARWQFSISYEQHPCHFIDTFSTKPETKVRKSQLRKIKMKSINQLAIFGCFLVKRRYFGDKMRNKT